MIRKHCVAGEYAVINSFQVNVICVGFCDGAVFFCVVSFKELLFSLQENLFEDAHKNLCNFAVFDDSRSRSFGWLSKVFCSCLLKMTILIYLSWKCYNLISFHFEVPRTVQCFCLVVIWHGSFSCNVVM